MFNDKSAIQQPVNVAADIAITLDQLAERIVLVDETLREQAALSKDKAALKRYIQRSAKPMEPKHILRDPMTLEFLSIPVPYYTDENVSTKVVKIIQNYVGIVNKMVWRKG